MGGGGGCTRGVCSPRPIGYYCRCESSFAILAYTIYFGFSELSAKYKLSILFIRPVDSAVLCKVHVIYMVRSSLYALIWLIYAASAMYACYAYCA